MVPSLYKILSSVYFVVYFDRMKYKHKRKCFHQTLMTGIAGTVIKQGKLLLVISAHVYFTGNVRILVLWPMGNGNAHLAR